MPGIQVYTDPEMKRRIELTAARLDVPVTQYCLEAIKQRLEDEELLDKEMIDIPANPEREDVDVIADLRTLRERILERRGGQPITRDILDELQEET